MLAYEHDSSADRELDMKLQCGVDLVWLVKKKGHNDLLHQSLLGLGHCFSFFL